MNHEHWKFRRLLARGPGQHWLGKEEAAIFAGQSARAGGATEAAARGLHQEDIQHPAGVSPAEWLSWYNRRYLAERLRASHANGF